MKQLRLFLSVLFLILMIVPAQAQKIDTEVYYRLTNKVTSPEFVLSIRETQSEGIMLVMSKPSVEISRLWRFVDLGNGFFRLMNASQPSMSLELREEKIGSETFLNMVLLPSADRTAQQWKLSPNAGGIRLTNRWKADQSITFWGDERDLKIDKTGNASPQAWMLNQTDIKVGKVADYVKEISELRKIDTKVFYRLIIESKPKLALDIYSSSDQGDYTPIMKKLSTDRSQLWRFVDKGEGFFILINASQPNLCIDVIDDSNTLRVELKKTGGGTGQLWKLTPNQLGFNLTNHWQAGSNLTAFTEPNSVDFGNLFIRENDDSTVWMPQKTNIKVEGQTDVAAKEKFELTSTAFVNGARIPFEHTGAGTNISPPLAWKGAPAGTKSFMILCTDPDAPSPANPDPNPFVHWFVLNIPADTNFLLAGLPALAQLSTPFGAIQVANSDGKTGYTGPMPPKGSGKHRYIFTILAMDRVHVLDPKLSPEFVKILDSSVLGKAELMGTYEIPAVSFLGSLLLRK